MAGRTGGQQLALDQLAAIARASGGSVSVSRMVDPTKEEGPLHVDVSLSCAGIEHVDGGITLHGRERFQVTVPGRFPFVKAFATATHRRWAGTPHVHWGRLLCLYQAASDWDPGQGMYGFIKRLELWLTRAAAGELDPDDAPLHPPMIYGKSGSTLFIPRANTPELTDQPWLGFARLDIRSQNRIDIVGWEGVPSDPSALAILLPSAFSWEYPETVGALFAALERDGLVIDGLWRLLMRLSRSRPDGEPLHVVVGTPMRRGHDGQRRQHLAVWEIEATLADDLRLAAPKADDSEKLQEVRGKLSEALLNWARETKLVWCSVSEERPEIVVRRDDGSPLPNAFAGKAVSIWGCGAIGANVAEWIARARAKRLVIHDYDTVTPGVLVRQPFTDADVGRAKSFALRERLLAIRPELEVDHRTGNILTGPLETQSWHDNADLVVDATASAAVRLKLEMRLRDGADRRTVVALLLGHEAERGLAVVAPAGYSGGIEDVMRRAKISCAGAEDLRGFDEEFWPQEPRQGFQPEPGCSDLTFRGSGAEVAALSAAMLREVSATLNEGEVATTHLFALPGVVHKGRRSACLQWSPSVVLRDGVSDYQIRLSTEALADIRGWAARNDRALDPASETGGILYGRRDETARIVWIDSVSGPPPDSIASAVEFVCGTEGVAEMTEERSRRSQEELRYLGIWHTHPDMSPRASIKDLSGMLGLVASEPLREALMLIVGGAVGDEHLAGYVFNGDRLQKDKVMTITIEPKPEQAPAPEPPLRRDVGLALSGGGSRALAFHLGCLRALHDRDVLCRVRVISGVSGGGLMSALWAYGPDRFVEFDRAVSDLLSDGLQSRIVRRSFLSRRLPQGLATSAIGSVSALAARAAGRVGGAPTRRWTSRTDAFEDVLREVLGGRLISGSRREEGLDVVINACELRTGHAFRFGSRESASWRLGKIAGNQVELATAVAASAAYPLLLPALDRSWVFEARDGTVSKRRVVLTDGGVFDNLGTSCLRPGRSPAHSYNVFDIDYVISCDAGRGQLGDHAPFHFASRVRRSFDASFRKLQDAGRSSLYEHRAHGELKGLVVPYLGMQDSALSYRPPDLVGREEVCDYPTDFAPMDAETIELLARRGEQQTRLLIERWCPEL